MVVWRIFPSSPRRGGRDINKISRSLLYGADGVVVKFHRILLRLNTIITGCALSRLHSLRSSPSARTKDASRRFLIAQPPLLGEEGKIRHTTIWATAPRGRGPDKQERPRHGGPKD